MSPLIGQHLIIGLSGTSLTSDEKSFLVKNNIGGIIFFSRNVVDPKQIHDFCSEIQSLRNQLPDKSPFFIGIDMEGGRVARLKAPFTQWPPLKKLGDLDSPSVSFQLGQFMGQELRSVGINLNFAPVADILTNPKNQVIGDRAISSDPEMVGKHVSALIRGYVKSEVIACVKHFPGHGNTLLDSHEDLPVEEADMARLESIELQPFKKAFRSSAEMVMTAHIRFKNIDSEWPVTLSEKFLKTLLRQELRYRGLIISDDLDMKALTKNYSKELIPVRALQAGVNILLYCNEPDSPSIALNAIEGALSQGQLKKMELEQSYKLIQSLKKDWLSKPEPQDMKIVAQTVGHSNHFKLAQAIAAGEIPSGMVNIA